MFDSLWRLRQVHAALLALPAAALLAHPVTAQDDLRDLARRKDSVVKLELFDASGNKAGSGSGFFVDSDVIVTNWHVVEGAERVEAVLASRDRIVVEALLVKDEFNDVAVLQVKPGPYPTLSLVGGGRVEMGQRIVVLGSPLGLASTLSEGIISAVRTEGLDDEYDAGDNGKAPVLQISAAISPGSSGSPVMNLKGEVVGVAVSQIWGGQNLNFAVPVSAVRRTLARVDRDRPVKKYQAQSAMSAVPYIRNVAISVLFFAGLFYFFKRLR